MVFGNVLPTWLFVLRDLEFEAVFVVLRSDTYLSEVETLVGDKCGVWCGADWSGLVGTGPTWS